MDELKSFKPDQTQYKIEELLGEGLNSKVYRALRIDAAGHSRQRVALKFLKDQTSVSFLRREFETLAGVRSPYCARVISWETRNDESVLALEWVDGVTLYDFAQAVGPALETEEIDEITRQIYLGLSDLRAAGLFHGDLQPKNVMVDRQGLIRLIDFANGRTEDGRLQATSPFAAPEVWASGHLSFEADLFALGVIRQHLATGFRELESAENLRTWPSRRDSLMRLEPEARTLRVLTDNPAARVRVGSQVEQILGRESPISTQVFVADENRAPLSSRATPHRFVARPAVAVALSLLIGVTVPVLADIDPVSRDAKTAQLNFSSEHWMKIAVNGRDAGFTPLTLTQLHAGPHRITWKTAEAAGEIKIVLNANSLVRYGETRSGLLKVR